MKRWNSILYGITFLMFVMGLIVMIRSNQSQTKLFRINESVLCDDFSITVTQARKLQTEECAALFAMEQDDVRLENKELAQELMVTEVSLIGNSGILFPNQTILNYEDMETCLISSGTAYALFGTDQLTEAVVSMGEKEYLVVDVIKTKQCLFVHESRELKSEEGKNSYFFVLCNDSSLRNAQDSMDQFLMINGITGKTWRFLPYTEKMNYLVFNRNSIYQAQFLKLEMKRLLGAGLAMIGLLHSLIALMYKKEKRKIQKSALE